MYLMILGAPGSGKGTQGKLLADHLGIPQVSTGELLRAAVKNGTPLGRQAKGFMDQGLLVPDDVILGLIREILDSAEAQRGVLMDGFPRTVAQAEAVDRILAERGGRVDQVALLEVDEEELVQRLLGRATKEGRSDDNLQSIRQRLMVYQEQTAPLVAYYDGQGVVRRVAGMGSVEEIQERMQKAVRA
ncbi:MAG: adenylate kinase [Gemmatimonadetes bacterium]|nr:adenylate kinase [Gemmatimonadota bacterium]